MISFFSKNVILKLFAVFTCSEQSRGRLVQRFFQLHVKRKSRPPRYLLLSRYLQ
ncbi:hypothetical protein PBCV1_a470aL [Paramecium bursaria Chlorella virus 1]|uniref:Uncharacterized protein n=1 Tax=Paramecium bursaria Chlorella virus 1 TaxID=10506 RepID=F8TU44_PBCV1|nr:hypothetical protein PBCV1_a470aL [Paramecium bursaria Chlorella virus 1]AEI70105.1 hypothetical protein [Paramecium bursaria Chlorella virus 1]